MTKDQSSPINGSISSAFGAKLTLIAWLGMLGVDFFLHAGLLAGVYTRGSPFLLSALDAFKRIPIGYLSFLIVAGFLVWLAFRLRIEGVRQGLLLGLAVGLVMWISLGLGLYSISTARPLLLVSWAIGQSAEMAFAGGLIGMAMQREALKQAFFISLVTTITLVILTIALQSIGIVQSTRLASLWGICLTCSS